MPMPRQSRKFAPTNGKANKRAKIYESQVFARTAAAATAADDAADDAAGVAVATPHNTHTTINTHTSTHLQSHTHMSCFGAAQNKPQVC